ncbi:DUF4321 domain-containing protein [Proteiniborus sp. MB09-C3]|uniref:DUF4321 domain-containing protein n=1 Tax=Proteiniborus sp. MB09-C3 TaxID=3050072 RepID=UPI002555A6E5|nr:DUF4321 domain-containing protein [Proteiniborus sp. MB09-C3]WIV10594.1 DUF4321 domain-containing protein [Proteiniborus sp. MB09-C3]
MRPRNRNLALLFALTIIGVVLGSVIGNLLGDKIPLLSYSYPIGIKTPVHLDLSVIELTFGLIIDINIASAIGFLLAFFMYKRL